MRCHRIAIFGGSGFIGRALICRLAQEKRQIFLVSRAAEKQRDLKVIPGLTILPVNALEQAIQRADTVINLIGILNEKGHNGQEFQRVHVDYTRYLVELSQHYGIRRFLQMSALHAHAEHGSSAYLRSKGAAEDIAHTLGSSSMAVSSFCPSVVFGPGDGLFCRFARLLRWMPVFLLACPNSRLSPLYIGDLVTFITNSLDDSASYSRHHPICGPQDYSLQELLLYTAQLLGKRRWIIPLSDPLSRLQATVMENIPGKPFSLDNYASLQTDSVCEAEDNRQKTSIESVVPRYIGALN